jgi:purine-nucleoside/S-methyl-5'-thioadenosine phosphorylase / adenosine deaminase
MLHASSLDAIPRIRHAFFTREGGVSEGVYASLNGGQGSNDRLEKVAENRARMAAALGVRPDSLINAYQVHSPDVMVAEKPWTRETRPRADGIVTQVPGLAVAVSTADCAPVLFADEAAGVVAAAHAGWKGALTGIIESTIAAMEKLGADRSCIAVALGPMIRQPSYEVGPEFIARFRAADPDNERFFTPASRHDHAQFDLAGFILARLNRAGILHVEDLGFCTYADPRFFSYRRATHRADPDFGRHINAIVLVE